MKDKCFFFSFAVNNFNVAQLIISAARELKSFGPSYLIENWQIWINMNLILSDIKLKLNCGVVFPQCNFTRDCTVLQWSSNNVTRSWLCDAKKFAQNFSPIFYGVDNVNLQNNNAIEFTKWVVFQAFYKNS